MRGSTSSTKERINNTINITFNLLYVTVSCRVDTFVTVKEGIYLGNVHKQKFCTIDANHTIHAIVKINIVAAIILAEAEKGGRSNRANEAIFDVASKFSLAY